MNIKEFGEDLEQQFGKPRNITEENVCFMLSLIKEEFDGEKVNEDVNKPSLDAFGMTLLAVMSYQTTPWEELAKKPSIRKTLKYIAIRGGNHYDEIEALTIIFINCLFVYLLIKKLSLSPLSAYTQLPTNIHQITSYLNVF